MIEAWTHWVGPLACALSGMVLGWQIGHARGARWRRRRDQAGMFDHGDIITMGDGSRLRVVETLAPENEGTGDG